MNSVAIPVSSNKLPEANVQMLAVVTLNSPPIALDSQDDIRQHFAGAMWEYDTTVRKGIQVRILLSFEVMISYR